MGIPRKLKKAVKKDIKNSSSRKPFKKKKITWTVSVGDLVEFVNSGIFSIVLDKKVVDSITYFLVTDDASNTCKWVSAKKVRRTFSS